LKKGLIAPMKLVFEGFQKGIIFYIEDFEGVFGFFYRNQMIGRNISQPGIERA
jgi:hypothetical protein